MCCVKQWQLCVAMYAFLDDPSIKFVLQTMLCPPMLILKMQGSYLWLYLRIQWPTVDGYF